MIKAFRIAFSMGLVAAALSSCTARHPRALGDRPLLANPSAIASAEIAFARMAQDKGQWTAFRRYAADGADMFVPQRVAAQDWLKGRNDPPAAVRWQPQRIFMACDGFHAVSTGAWQRPDGSQGYFTTVWARQRDGAWKWLLDHGDTLAQVRVAADAIQTRVAACEGRAASTPLAPVAAGDFKAGHSGDGSLRWSSAVAPDGSRHVTAQIWTGNGYETILDDIVVADARPAE